MTGKRDYAAEYKRRKQLAQQAGYKSEREYKQVRANMRRALQYATGERAYKRTAPASAVAKFYERADETGYTEHELWVIAHIEELYPGEYPPMDDREFWTKYLRG